MTTSSNLLNKVLAWSMRRAQDELVQLNDPFSASTDFYRMDIPYLMTLAHRPPADPRPPQPVAVAAWAECPGPWLLDALGAPRPSPVEPPLL